MSLLPACPACHREALPGRPVRRGGDRAAGQAHHIGCPFRDETAGGEEMVILPMNIPQRHPRSHVAVFPAAAPLSAAGPVLAEEIPITLDTAVRAAIERNLDLRVQAFTPALSETDVRRARAIFDPNLSLLLDPRGSNAPPAPESPFVERSRFFDANFSTDVLLSSGAPAP